MKHVPIVLTVVADDHPGIVEDLSDALATHDGNWTESSMMTLAGKFAGILLAEVPEARADSFLRVLDSLEAGGLRTTLINAVVAATERAAQLGKALESQ